MLPFRWRRLLVRLVAPVASLFLGVAAPSVVEGCARTMGFSKAESRRFLRRKFLIDLIFLLEWSALANRRVSGLIRDAAHVSASADEELRWLAAQPGAILATMHFGPYSLGLVWLIHQYFRGREIIIIKSDKDDVVEEQAMRRLSALGVTMTFVSATRQGDFFDLVKRVRGGAVCMIMVDLPPDYGRGMPTLLMGHEIEMTAGAVDLAGLCAVPMMLFRSTTSVGHDRLEICEMFEVDRRDPRSREIAARRMSTFVARSIVDYPDHWHMWERIREYAPASPERTAA